MKVLSQSKQDHCDAAQLTTMSTGSCSIPLPLPFAHIRLLLYLAAVQNIPVLLLQLSVLSAQRTNTVRYVQYAQLHRTATMMSTLPRPIPSPGPTLTTNIHAYHNAHFLLLAPFPYSLQQKDEVSSQLEVTPVD